MKTFEELGLQASILESISELGFEHPSPIQEEVIPYLLANTGDVVGLAQTGTGKTAAFGLPMLQLVDSNSRSTQGLILAPTRELCVQIATEMGRYGAKLPNTRIVAVYGGEDIRKQLKDLDRTPQILVATPGRLLDLIKRKKVFLDKISLLVLDEADEMLNMGFLDDITEIIEQTSDDRHTLLFSATMPREIASIASRYMHNAKEISVGKRNEAAKNVEHNYVLTKPTCRYEVLKRILDFNPDIYGIVFCRTRQETKDVADKLMIDGYNADALHGDLSQAQRDSVMSKFRIRNLQILVATDVAARGLDVNDLTHVIHYNLPDDRDTYTHRSGRTGRVNKSGISIALITPREKGAIRPIEKEINRTFIQMDIPSGLEVCQRQVLNMAERMQQVEVDEKLQKYLPNILELLKDMSKEEVISRFISLEFNRFLEYYKNAPDLNSMMKREAVSGDGDFKKSRRNVRRIDKGNTIRLKIDKGRRDGFEPKRLLGLINDVTNDKSINIGDIDVSPKFTFFDVDKSQLSRLIDAFANNPKAKGVQINEVKGEQKSSSGRSGGDRGERRDDNRRSSSGSRDSRSSRDSRDSRDGQSFGRRRERVEDRRPSEHSTNSSQKDDRVSKRKRW